MAIQWREWGPEAFRLAKAGDQPILLAITSPYPAICRVMDRDAWSDAEVARLAEAEYVCVRVDADARPDVNERYNCGALPSTVFLTPEGDLLWGATFIPREDLRLTLVRLKTGYATNRAKLAEAIKERDTRITRAQLGIYDSRPEITEEIMRRTLRGILGTYDPLFGGFGKAPKLPLASSLRLLVRAFAESGGSEFEGVLIKSLDALDERGLFDPVEGGFFTCSRNETWTQPETEKMLADQAGLAEAFLEAGVVFESERYLETARRTLGYVAAALSDGAGLFYAGQAADAEYYALPGRANKPPVAPAVYVDACAQMISAQLRAAAVLGEDARGAAAVKGLQRLLGEARDPKGGMLHAPGGTGGLLRDQVATAAALLDAYEWSADERFLAEADRLLSHAVSSFWDRRDGGLLDRQPGRDELGELSKRRRRIAENASAAISLSRLGRLDDAKRILGSWPDYREDYGHHTAEYALAADACVRPPTTITLEYPSSDEALPAMRTAALRPVVPRRVVKHARSEARRAVVTRGEKAFAPVTRPEELMALLT
jgi:hypothetical protein